MDACGKVIFLSQLFSAAWSGCILKRNRKTLQNISQHHCCVPRKRKVCRRFGIKLKKERERESILSPSWRGTESRNSILNQRASQYTLLAVLTFSTTISSAAPALVLPVPHTRPIINWLSESVCVLPLVCRFLVLFSCFFIWAANLPFSVRSTSTATTGPDL